MQGGAQAICLRSFARSANLSSACTRGLAGDGVALPRSKVCHPGREGEADFKVGKKEACRKLKCWSAERVLYEEPAWGNMSRQDSRSWRREICPDKTPAH